jgi:uncharacterized membrane protein YbhN (UPF0104 family)
MTATGSDIAAPTADAKAGAAESGAADAIGIHRRRHWVLRLVIALLVLAALAFAGRRFYSERFYSELWRVRRAPPGLVLAVAALWLASRYPAADVMRVGLRALGHRIGRYEAFMLQMVQSYGNVLLPRAGISGPAVYLKLRHRTPFADLGAVQLLPMTLVQIFTIGLVGLACQFVLWRFYGERWERPLAVLFAGASVACVAPLLVPLPTGRTGTNRLTRFLARLIDAWHKLGRSPGMLLRVVLTHAGMLLLRAWRIQLCFLAVGQPVHYLGALTASLLADLAFVISITPAGLGFREWAIVYAARMMHATGDVALAAAVLDRLIGIACNVVVGQLGVWQLIRPALRQAPHAAAA